MFVIVGGTSFSQVFQNPGLIVAGLESVFAAIPAIWQSSRNVVLGLELPPMNTGSSEFL
jgi:hypothetical protein